MVRKLDVWLFTEHVGTLTLAASGRLNFCYTSAWLQRPDAMALSYSLPLQAASFDDQAARPFFAGLLPEGNLRRLIAQKFHVSRQNDFVLLDRMGGECAGAVTLMAPGDPFPLPARVGEVEWLTPAELEAVLDELPHSPMLAGTDGLRLSLAGAQNKLPVVVEGERIGLPRHGMPSTHILKPAIHTVEHSVINEGFCLALAAAMQLTVVGSRIWHIKDRSFLMVERYDRTVNAAGHLQRLHQEDFCQALGIHPELKYQNEGGPNLMQCFDLVRRITRPHAPQVLRLLDYVIFNAFIGNHDAHAKNFSLLYHEKIPVLAPLYDALSTAVYDKLTSKMAMKLGGKYRFSQVEMRHWEKFAQDTGLSIAEVKKRIVDMAGRLPQVARQLQADSAGGIFIKNPLVEKIIQLIEQRISLTIRRLTHDHA